MKRLVAASLAVLLAATALGSGAWGQSMEASPPTAGVPDDRPPASAVAGAVAVNIFRIPGKTLLCGVTVLTTTGMMLLTFGTQYRLIGAIFREGCGGKWVLEPADLDRNVDAPAAIYSSTP
jgi:hypothetical protein